MTEVRAVDAGTLARRTSVKYTLFPADVIPMFVAEMDLPLFPAIRERLRAMLDVSDTGYLAGPLPVAEAFSGFAQRHWDWRVDPAEVGLTTDVSVTIVETLRRTIRPGDGVVIMPPIYPPFFDLVPEAGGTVVEVPLLAGEPVDGAAHPDWRMDLAGIDAALAAGARAVLLCSPHNPLGHVFGREELAELSRVVAAHDAVVLADEIHAPLAHPGVDFVPYLTVSEAAREHGMALHSPSKAFGLAGLKCALMVAGGERMRAALAAMPEEVQFRTGIFGAAASEVAYRDGDDWLAGVVATLAENRALLERRVAELLPRAVLTVPRATFIAWLDLSAYGLGDDPSAVLRETARVALGTGPDFGAPGRGHVRLNYACAPETLEEALRRIAAALPSDA